MELDLNSFMFSMQSESNAMKILASRYTFVKRHPAEVTGVTQSKEGCHIIRGM